MRGGWLTYAALLASSTLAGCRLPGTEGPVSRSLATSRHLSQQGVAAAEHGQWDRAESFLSQAVQACPGNPDARRSLAEALWNRGAGREALGQLEKVSRMAPDDASLHARIAEMQLALGQADAAVQNAERAIDLDPKLAAAWRVRAKVSAASSRPIEALADYQRALGLQPEDREVALEIAELYRTLNQPGRALATLQALADKYAPGEEPQRVLYLQGVACMALHRFDDAAESLAAAAAREPPTAELFCRLAEAHLSAGRAGDAAAAAQRALALDPKHQPSHQLLGYVELARQPGSNTPR